MMNVETMISFLASNSNLLLDYKIFQKIKLLFPCDDARVNLIFIREHGYFSKGK